MRDDDDDGKDDDDGGGDGDGDSATPIIMANERRHGARPLAVFANSQSNFDDFRHTPPCRNAE